MTGQPNLTDLADELHRLSALAFALTPRASSPGPHRLSELPEPCPEWETAHAELRRFGEQLAGQGSNLMTAVYDEAVERHGYEGVRGVNGAWDGVGGWVA